MLKTIRNKISQYSWALAYGQFSEEIITNGINFNECNYVKNPYKNKWFADPFILEEDDNTLQLLVEEYDSSLNRGRIARLVIDKKEDKIKECNIILDLDTHLSFPAIYRLDGKIYVHPENSASGKSILYEYDRSNDRLVNPVVLIDEPLTDAIIVKGDNAYEMYATKVPHACGSCLHKYIANKFEGPYQYLETTDYTIRSARLAGYFLNSPNGQIRVAQDCCHDYGEAVLFYSNNNKVGEIRPKGFRVEGVHTFNTLGQSYIIDLKVYKHSFIHKVLKSLKYGL